MSKNSVKRARVGTSLNKTLYKKIQTLAIEEDTDANKLLEEGMRRVLELRRKRNNNAAA